MHAQFKCKYLILLNAKLNSIYFLPNVLEINVQSIFELQLKNHYITSTWPAACQNTYEYATCTFTLKMCLKDFVSLSYFMYFIISVHCRRSTVSKTQSNCKKVTSIEIWIERDFTNKKGNSNIHTYYKKGLGFTRAINDYLYDDCKAERVYNGHII